VPNRVDLLVDRGVDVAEGTAHALARVPNGFADHSVKCRFLHVPLRGAHAIGLDPQRGVEEFRGIGGEVIRPVDVGDARGAHTELRPDATDRRRGYLGGDSE
jgi:hypothetical protein